MASEKALTSDYKVAGIAKLRERFPSQTAGLTDAGIAAAYSWWSEEEHFAGWLTIDDYTADQFGAYAFRQCAALPTPADLSAYLRGRRWSFRSVQANWAIYTSGEGESKVTLEVPQLVGARDYGRAVLLVIEELARIEARPAVDILSDVLAASLDERGDR